MASLAGIRNQVFGGFAVAMNRPDRGMLMENFVFAELLRSTDPLLDTLRYWRSKGGAEVDFVVEHQGRRLAVEVKAGDARGRVTRSIRSFLAAYDVDALLVVNERSADPLTIDGQRVEFVTPDALAFHVARFRD